MVRNAMFPKRLKITMISDAYDADFEAKVNDFIQNRDIGDIQYSACHHYGSGIVVKQAFIFYYE